MAITIEPEGYTRASYQLPPFVCLPHPAIAPVYPFQAAAMLMLPMLELQAADDYSAGRITDPVLRMGETPSLAKTKHFVAAGFRKVHQPVVSTFAKTSTLT